MVTYNGEEIGGSQTKYSESQNRFNDLIEIIRNRRRKKRKNKSEDTTPQYTPASPIQQPTQEAKTTQPPPQPNKYGATLLTRAPTFKEQLMNQGGYAFLPNLLISKSLGRQGNWEQMNNRGQSLFTGETGERVTKIAQTGQYFIPVYGQVLAASQGVETLARPSNYKGKGWKGAGTIGLSVLGILSLGSLKKPNGTQSLTKVASQDLEAYQIENKLLIESQSKAITTTPSIFGNKQTFSAVNSKALITPIDDAISDIKVISAGVSSDMKGLNLATQKEVYGKPKPFVSVSRGTIEESKITIGNEAIKQELEAVKVVFAGKTQTGKKVNANFLEDLTLNGWKLKGTRQPQMFVGGGFSTPINENFNLIYLKSANVVKKKGADRLSKDINKIIGIHKNKPINDVGSFGTILRFDKKTFSENVVKAIDEAVIKSTIPKNTNKFKPPRTQYAASGLSLRTTSQSDYYGLGQYERTDAVTEYKKMFNQPSNIWNNNFTNLNTNVKTISGLTPRTRSHARSKQDSLNKELERVIPRLNEVSTLKNPSRQREKLMQRQLSKQIQNHPNLNRLALKPMGSKFRFINLNLPKYNLNQVTQTEAGYKAYIKTSKRKREVIGIFGKGEALYRLQKELLSHLSATGGIKRIGGAVKSSQYTGFKISETLFRPYKIRNRKAIPLVNEYIQRRDKRLFSSLEKAEIQNYKKKKGWSL